MSSIAAVESVIDDRHESLYGDVPAIFTHRDWKRATKTQISEREWHRDHGGLLEDAVAARRVALDCEVADLEALGIELADDAKDVCHHLTVLSKRI